MLLPALRQFVAERLGEAGGATISAESELGASLAWVEGDGGGVLGETAWFDAFPRELQAKHAVAAYQFWAEH